MKMLKKIWNYFFPPRDPLEQFLSRAETHEIETFEPVKFFEPVTPKEVFNNSKTIDDFLNKISKNNINE